MKRWTVILLLCSGCQMGVPTTHITFEDPSGVSVTYDGPKQFKADGFKAEVTRHGKDTDAKVSWDHLAAENDPTVIQQAGVADAVRTDATTRLIEATGQQVLNGVKTGLAKGASGGIAP